ncbi:hypothetical protein F5884DRAFT_785890 [Xylogone sp. PMI_703]|nr:hypothetical protein F5884DRAFT_785890 [Xylogone sp. PMI_703]
MMPASVPLPSKKVPFDIHLGYISALSRALVGQQRWDDPEVVTEKEILLFGTNEERAEYIMRWRAKAAVAVYEAYERKIALEARLYGEHSFAAVDLVEDEIKMET